jgi:hypothetical protein
MDIARERTDLPVYELSGLTEEETLIVDGRNTAG